MTDNILEILPHRPPYLFVDKLIETETTDHIIGIKNLTYNETYFQEKSGKASMPESFLIEAISQTATALFAKNPEFKGQSPTISKIETIEFKKSAHPGDQIRIEAEITKRKESSIYIDAKVLIEGKLIAEGRLLFEFAKVPSKAKIHQTASVHPTAILGKDVVVGPYSIIGENVIIGDRTVIEAHVMIDRLTRIGDDCHLNFGTVIGSKPQDLKYKDEESWVVIGDRNILREYVTINRATGKGEATILGNDNMLMTSVHIAHNCVLGNNITLANLANVAGHSIIEDKVIIGGLTGVHQFVRLGRGAMIGGYARVVQDIPPYMLCEGNPAQVRSINAVGLKRSGASMAALKEVKTIFKEVFRSGKNTSQAFEDLNAMGIESNEGKEVIKFCLADSKRGINLKKESDTAE